ncbi:cytidine deaminase [Williamsia deligens]|uniref:Cytidine deaminase n=1 Tax=Williamsia deligens TaxID=321325 RepID=A0ABW3GD04_9NOCA|nr:cytidine deaminase [Williamsia deligens]MCP2192318.1 cytidine deaminase [Williamsia deligens]
MVSEATWDRLRDNARRAGERAYAPYSHYPVGAAGITADGRWVHGCNVENVSYGLGVCAEVALVTDLHVSGGGRLVAVSVADGSGAVIMPCGRCRQVLLEHGGADLLIDHPRGPRPLAELLPDAFGPDDLEARR